MLVHVELKPILVHTLVYTVPVVLTQSIDDVF